MKNFNFKKSIVSILIIFVLSVTAYPQFITKTLRFTPAQTKIKLKGTVTAGKILYQYFFRFRKNQKLDIKLTSKVGDARFGVWDEANVSLLEKFDENFNEINSAYATAWSTIFSYSDEIAVTVDTTRGSTDFSLSIELK